MNRLKMLLFCAVFVVSPSFSKPVHRSDCVFSASPDLQGVLKKYKNQVSALGMHVGEAKELAAGLRSMERVIEKRFDQVDRIDKAIRREKSGPARQTLEAEKNVLLQGIKVVIKEQQRLGSELDNMVSQAKMLRVSIDRLEDWLEDAFEKKGSAHGHDDFFDDFESMMPNVSVSVHGMPDIGQRINQIQQEFAQAMAAMRQGMDQRFDELSGGFDDAPAVSMHLHTGSAPGSNVMGKSFSSSSVEQRSFGSGGSQGQRKVSKTWSSNVDGQRKSGSVSGVATKAPGQDQWSFEVEKVHTDPEGQKNRAIESGKAADLREFERRMSSQLAQ